MVYQIRLDTKKIYARINNAEQISTSIKLLSGSLEIHIQLNAPCIYTSLKFTTIVANPKFRHKQFGNLRTVTNFPCMKFVNSTMLNRIT